MEVRIAHRRVLFPVGSEWSPFPMRPSRAPLRRYWSVLPLVHKGARIFHRRLLQVSVAEIQDVADAARFLDGFAGRPAHPLFRAKEDNRVHVALQCDAVTN